VEPKPKQLPTVNKDFKMSFHWRAIYYQVQKIQDSNFGKLTEDASNLFSLFQQDSELNNSFFKVESDDENRLANCCFMSKRMKTLMDYFYDVVIIDATHKSNRFNLPLLDIVIINNLRKTCFTFFALLKNQQFESYAWALQHFKSQIKKVPTVIFSDDEESLVKGKYYKFFKKYF